MKQNLIILFCMLFGLQSNSVQAQKRIWSAGIEGGPGLSLIYGNEGVYSNTHPSLAGVAGIFAEYGFATNFSAKVALHYERISARTDNFSALLPPGGKLQFSLDYISLPALVKWNFGFGERLRFFVNAGPCLSYLWQESLWYLPESGSKSKVANETEAYNSINLALTAGAGVTVPISKQLIVSLEIRDNFGLLNIRSATSDFEQQSNVTGTEPKGFTNSTLLVAGVIYRLTKGKGMPCTPDDPDFQYIRK